jgi:alanyl aminopeptidase
MQLREVLRSRSLKRPLRGLFQRSAGGRLLLLACALACARAPAGGVQQPSLPRATPPALRLPEGARPTSYALALRIDPAQPTLTGTIDIELQLAAATSFLWLNATDIDVSSAQITFAGESVVARPTLGDRDFLGFAFRKPVGPGPASLRISYVAGLSDREMAGAFRQKEGRDWYAFTQFEATDARRAFPCFDEPEFKVPWRVSLTVRREQVALGNTPVLGETDAGAGWKTVQFYPSRPMPSYLVAFAVGPFALVDAGKAGAKRTAIRVVAPRERAVEARYAVESSGPLLERLEKLYGIPYPYEKLDLVAIPQFGGAMENPGLITFAQTLLLMKPAEETITGRRNFAETYAHEAAHQWFGDLVTTAWWDDIWLNEAFANWAGPKAIDDWKPAWNAAVERVEERASAMAADTLTSARKIRQPIASNSDIANAFDGITYEKGRAVLEMFEAWLGSDVFNHGVRRYLRAHSWKNATSADFVAAISAEAGFDVAPAFSTFLDQVGVPLVSVDLTCPKNAAPRVTLAQSRYLPLGSKAPAGQRWQIPVCLAFGSAKGRYRQCQLLTEPRAEVTLPGKECPAWLLPNDGLTGYYRSLPSSDLLKRLLDDGGKRLSLAERVGVLSDLRALVDGGLLPAAAVLDLVPVLLDESRGDLHVSTATAEIVAGLDANLVSEELRPGYARFVRKLYAQRAHALGWKPKPGEDEDTGLLRRQLVPLVANQGEDRALVDEAGRLVRAWLDQKQGIEPDMLDVALDVAARHGDRALYDRILEAARKTTDRRDRRRLITALASFEDPALVGESLRLFLSSDFDPRESGALLFGGQRGRKRRQATGLTLAFVKSHYDAILARVPQGVFAGGEFAAALPWVAADACDQQTRADVESFFRDRSAKAVGGPRVLDQVLEGINLCAQSAAAQRDSVAAFLRKW